jgi:hypothetical protein
MDLSNPMIDKNEIKYLESLIEEDFPELNSELFVQCYHEDKLGGIIRNVESWVEDNFSQFKGYK